MPDGGIIRTRIIRRRGAAAQGVGTERGVVGDCASCGVVGVVHGAVTNRCAFLLGDVGKEGAGAHSGVVKACCVSGQRFGA